MLDDIRSSTTRAGRGRPICNILHYLTNRAKGSSMNIRLALIP